MKPLTKSKMPNLVQCGLTKLRTEARRTAEYPRLRKTLGRVARLLVAVSSGGARTPAKRLNHVLAVAPTFWPVFAGLGAKPCVLQISVLSAGEAAQVGGAQARPARFVADVVGVTLPHNAFAAAAVGRALRLRASAGVRVGVEVAVS